MLVFMEKPIKQPESKGSRQSLAEKEAVKVKTRILNLLIALAVVLNLWLGWQLGTLYGRGPEAATATQAAISPCAKSGASNIRHALPDTYAQQEEVEELNRRIADVIDQLARMDLPPDTVLIIRPDGPALTETDDPALSAGAAAR